MCGLAGVLVGRHPRTELETASAATLFCRLLVLSEHRGPYATGAAVVTEDGAIQMAKSPTPAHRFVHSAAYAKLCRQTDAARVTLLMGHTRWPTQGSHLHNENNQPLLSNESIGLALTHNGNIPDVARHFNAFGLQRKWEVDSELLLRLACRRLSQDGLAVADMIRDLALCEGQIAAVMVAVSHPDEIVFVCRDRPIWIAYNGELDMLAYASEPKILLQALPDHQKWNLHHMPAETVWIMNCQQLMAPKVYPLTFTQGAELQ